VSFLALHPHLAASFGRLLESGAATITFDDPTEAARVVGAPADSTAKVVAHARRRGWRASIRQGRLELRGPAARRRAPRPRRAIIPLALVPKVAATSGDADPSSPPTPPAPSPDLALGVAPLRTLPELSRRSGIGLRLLRAAAASGSLATHKIGAWTRASETDFAAWLRATALRPVQADARAWARAALATDEIRRQRCARSARPPGP